MLATKSLVILFAAALCAGAVWAAGTEESAKPTPTHAQDFEWKELPPMPSSMGGQFVGVHNGALVIAGGTNWPVSKFKGGTKVWLDSVYVLEKDANQWREAAKLDHPVAYGVAGSHSTGIYCVGGADSTQHFAEAFRLTWTDGQLAKTPLPSLPKPCAYAGGVVVGDTMYVVGGLETPESKETTRSFWALNVTKPEEGWRELEPWPGPSRMLPAVASQGGNVYVISGANWAPGQDGKIKYTYMADAYSYSPNEAHSGWKTLTPPPYPVAAAPCIGFGTSQVFVFSGDDGKLVDQIEQLGDNHPGYTHDVLAYDTGAGTWATKGTIPECNLTTQAVMLNGRIVIAGGEYRPGVRSARVLSGKPGEM